MRFAGGSVRQHGCDFTPAIVAGIGLFLLQQNAGMSICAQFLSINLIIFCLAMSLPAMPSRRRFARLPPLGTSGSWVVVAVLLLSGCHGLPTAAPTNPQEAMFPTLKLNEDWAKLLWPSNERNWTIEQARLAEADIAGNLVTVRNIRDCRWRAADDFILTYYARTFDLDRLRNVYFIVVPFNEMPSLGHTMLSFEFDDGDCLAVSVEIRKEQGEAFSVVGGFFRQYELIYVVASERDLIGRRVNSDLCDVYLYRSTATAEQGRELLLDVLHRVNTLAKKPEFYNTLVNNCTTNIRDHINHLSKGRIPYDYRVLLPGLSDRLAYDAGLIERKGSYEATRQNARINYVASLNRDAADFSQAIRR